MSEQVCCKEIVEMRTTIRNGRIFLGAVIAIVAIFATVYGPRMNTRQESIDGKLDKLIETTHHTELKVEHIATEQVSLRRDLEAHMRRTEERHN